MRERQNANAARTAAARAVVAGKHGSPAMSASAHGWLALQACIGNQQVARLLQARVSAAPVPSVEGRTASPRLQARPEVSQPHDPLEHEADRVAERIHSAPALGPAISAGGAGVVQRKCDACASGAPCTECDPPGPRLQRKAESPAPAVAGGEDVGGLGPGRSLDAQTRAFFESRLGVDFSRVRVHHDHRASESARRMSAAAYTVRAAARAR